MIKLNDKVVVQLGIDISFPINFEIKELYVQYLKRQANINEIRGKLKHLRILF